MLQGKTLTASNVLSFTRVLFLIPIFWCLSQNTPAGNVWGLVFMGLAVLSDFLDGYLARRLGQISDLGKVLDPVADKICIVGVSLFLASPARENPFPSWFIATLMLREIFILGSGYVVYRRVGVITTSNIWGKTTSGLLAVMLIVYTLQIQHNPPWLTWLPSRIDRFLLWLSLSFMVVSTATYARRYYLLLGQGKHIAYGSGFLSTGDNSSQARQNGTKN